MFENGRGRRIGFDAAVESTIRNHSAAAIERGSVMRRGRADQASIVGLTTGFKKEYGRTQNVAYSEMTRHISMVARSARDCVAFRMPNRSLCPTL